MVDRARIAGVWLVLVACAASGAAQEAGNSVYGAGRRNTSGVVLGNLAGADAKDSVAAYFVEANVLLNVKADEYVALFGLAQQGATVPEANQRLDAQLADFRHGLQATGIKDADVFVDYVSQNRVYDFSLSGKTAKEQLAGFQVKKNVALRYKERAQLEAILAAASKASIFDLIKVDYVVADPAAARARLFDEASKVVAAKLERYAHLLGARPRPASVVQEKYNAFLPSEQYSAYVAYETGAVDAGSDVRVLEKRKTSTFYFNPLHPGEFDVVLNPGSVEPMVQYTLYLKVRCSLGQ